MTRVPVDADAPAGSERMGAQDVEGPEGPEPDVGSRSRGRRREAAVEVEIEREITKRHLIEAISSILVVILYMAFTLLRDRDSGVVVLDERDKGPEDDWDEHA